MTRFLIVVQPNNKSTIKLVLLFCKTYLTVSTGLSLLMVKQVQVKLLQFKEATMIQKIKG